MSFTIDLNILMKGIKLNLLSSALTLFEIITKSYLTIISKQLLA